MAARDPLLDFATENLRFEQLLGRGGMGAVYRGRQIRLDRPVAIKVIKPDLAADPGYRDRFIREAQTMGRLIHPNVVACHDFGPITGPDGGELLVMVMEFVSGASLGRMAADARLPVRQVLAWYAQAANALAAAHRLGIIHRDVKPDNIMITGEGVAKLADFGLARANDSVQVTATGALLGSPAYMSPEASLGHDPVPASDIYSLACSIFDSLAGRPPYHATSTLQVLHQHISAPPPAFSAARPDLAPLAPLLTRCLAKQAGERPDATALARELLSLADAIPPAATTAAPSKAVPLPAAARATPSSVAATVVARPQVLPALQRRLFLLGGLVVALLVLLVAIGAVKNRRQAAAPVAPRVEQTAAEPVPEPAAPSAGPTPAGVDGTTLLLAGSGLLGAELVPGHPAAPVGCPARPGQAPRMVMSQLGKLRLRPPAGSAWLQLVLHPGAGSAERVLRLDGQPVVLRPEAWQVVRLRLPPGPAERVLDGGLQAPPFHCAAAVASVDEPAWSDAGLVASMLVSPEAAHLRELVARRRGHGDFTRTVFIARPLPMRLFGETARQRIAESFIDGPAPAGLLVETDDPERALQAAIAGGKQWCFVLLDVADVPSGNLRADNWCLAVEEALPKGTLAIPVLGGLPTARNQVLWTNWIEQVRKRLPGLPILDLGEVRAFHLANDLPKPTPEQMTEGLAVALRDLRARLATALR